MVKLKNAENGHFLGFLERFGTKRGPNSYDSQSGTLQDVRDWKNKNTNNGAIMGYQKSPKKGP